MIDISESVAKNTVKFDRAISGEDLIAAVRAACGNAPERFHQEKTYDDGYRYVVGQTSHAPDENLLVTPDKTNAYIEPDKTYESAVVIRHDRPSRGSRTLARENVDRDIKAVLDFSERLEQAVRHGRDAGFDRSMDPIARVGGPRPVHAEDTAKDWGSSNGSRSQSRGYGY